MNSPFTVVVSAGTYHLPFDRLGVWMGGWAKAHPEARIIYQHGPGRPIAGAENHTILPAAELMDLFQTADVVVLQGGAGGVMDLRALQRVPIVVPRHPDLGEVIDNHQMLFTAQAVSLGLVHRADEQEKLIGLLESALAGTLRTRCAALEATEGVANTVAVLNALPDAVPWRTAISRSFRNIPGIVKAIR